MELVFIKAGNEWVAEFEVSGDFNLHIEKPTGKISLYQRTAGRKFDAIDGVGYLEGNSVFDYDFTAFVWPKTIRIVSQVEPTYAEVTSNGTITIHEVGVISFTIDGESFKAKEGMTWAEFCKSEYANDDFYLDDTDNYYFHYQGVPIQKTSADRREEPDDVIMANGVYVKQQPE